MFFTKKNKFINNKNFYEKNTKNLNIRIKPKKFIKKFSIFYEKLFLYKKNTKNIKTKNQNIEFFDSI